MPIALDIIPSGSYTTTVLSAKGRFLEAILQWTERELAGPGRPGTADRLVAKVERREALRPTSLGARGNLAARGGYVNPASKGARWCPGASRRSTPSRGSRGTGKPRTLCAARMPGLGCLKFESEIGNAPNHILRRMGPPPARSPSRGRQIPTAPAHC